MKNIKISEEQDRLIKEMIYGDINEMLNPNASAVNVTGGVGVTLTKPDGNSFNDPIAAIQATKKMPNLPKGSNVKSKFTANGDEYEVSSTDSKNNVYESILLTSGQIRRIQLKKLKENSTVIKKKDFTL